ncbi:MAG: hypothetical protein C0601_04980 [Candidatus Muiribacterium halophilum]|uniref:Uncharacterized protein n=1 Tax=Muiribacterium halophilum TaxID=2053465 RepID=A0A2N5ZI65_MUIH1|nr:MAG: hypothetical protein C0601_04980 [Candidatus Muirbacterium halophilum]
MKENTNLKELLILIFLIFSIILIGVFYYYQLHRDKVEVFSGDINSEFQELERLLRDDLKIYSEAFDSGGNSFSFYIFSNKSSDYDPMISLVEYNVSEESYLIRKIDGRRTHEFKDIRNVGCTYLDGIFKVIAGNSSEAIDIIVTPVKEILKEE